MHEDLIQELESLRQASGEVESTLNFVETQIVELKGFNESIDSLNKADSDEFFAPLGKGVFIRSKKISDTLLVDAGAGVFVNKTSEDAQTLIAQQIKKLEEIKVTLTNQLGEFAQELDRIRKSIER
jgi:prefoldin alpha subunit